MLSKEVATLVPIVVQPTCTKCLPAKLKLYTDIAVISNRFLDRRSKCFSTMDAGTVCILPDANGSLIQHQQETSLFYATSVSL